MSTPFYTPDDYNQYNVLDVPFSLVLANVYLLKHYLIVAIPFFAKVPFINIAALPLANVLPSQGQSNMLLLYSCIPALLVGISMARRLPHSGDYLRWIWQRGRLLLLSSIILEMLISIIYVLLEINTFSTSTLIFLYIDAVLIVFLFKSQRAKDAFAEFPAFKPKEK
jgi:hypothetical protein